MTSIPRRDDKARPATGKRPQPGPAPVGPAVRVPKQTPVETPKDPGPAPVGPAIENGRSD
jgi:hypothetical protein